MWKVAHRRLTILGAFLSSVLLGMATSSHYLRLINQVFPTSDSSMNHDMPTTPLNIDKLCEECERATVGSHFTCVDRIKRYMNGRMIALDQAQKIVSREYKECSACGKDTCRIDFNNISIQTDDAASRSLAIARKLKEQEKILDEFQSTFYMYPEPEIEQLDSKQAIRQHIGSPIYLQRYGLEALSEVELLDAFHDHKLRTMDPTQAQIFVVPTSTTSILTTYGTKAREKYKQAFDALINTTTFQTTNGHRHVLLALAVPLFSRKHATTMKRFGLTQYYKRLNNVVVATDSDAKGCQELLTQERHLYGDFGSVFRHCSKLVVKNTFGMGLAANMRNPYRPASFEKFSNSSYFLFYHTRVEGSMNNSTQYRHAPLNQTVINGLPRSSIGFDIPAVQWNERFLDSQFCLMIRGDVPNSHAFARSIRAGCIPVVVCDSFPLYSPKFKMSIDIHDYAVILDEKKFLQDPLQELLKIREISETEIRVKLSALEFAQRVTIPEIPDSLFVPAFLRETLATDTRP